MTAIRPRQMIAFTDELAKIAAGPGWASGLLERAKNYVSPSNLAGNYGRQMFLGAGAGAAGNIIRHRVMDTPEQRANSSMLAQGLHGAAGGAALAGGRILATQEGRKRAGGAAQRFYEREKYNITGKGLDHTTPEGLEKARHIGVVPQAVSTGDFLGRAQRESGELFGAAQRGPLREADSLRFAKRQKQVAAAEDLFKADQASIPGGLHALMTSGQRGAYLKNRWNSMDALGKGFTGLGALSAANALVRGPSQQEQAQGQGRFSKGLSTLGATVGGVVAPMSSWIGSGALVSSMQGAGKGLGTVADMGERAIRNRVGHVVPAEEQAQWQTQG